MASRSLYGVFAGERFALTTNRVQALTTAAAHGGYVRFMPYHRGNPSAYDAPTFLVSSVPLSGGDFRPALEQAAQPLLDLPAAAAL